MKKPRLLSYPLSAQRELWSDAQASLSLRWAHRSFPVFSDLELCLMRAAWGYWVSQCYGYVCFLYARDFLNATWYFRFSSVLFEPHHDKTCLCHYLCCLDRIMPVDVIAIISRQISVAVRAEQSSSAWVWWSPSAWASTGYRCLNK